MKVLMTGATGFIGSALCAQLKARGARITALSRRAPMAVMRRCGELRVIASFDELAGDEGFDLVVNLAGEPIADRPWTPARRRQLIASRVDLTSALIDYLQRCEPVPAVLLSASAVGYYGDGGDRVLDERTPPRDDFAHRLCRDWEQQALRAEALGVRVCLLRTGLVLGPGGGFLARLLLPFKLGLGGRLGDGRQWMPWVHIEDWLGMAAMLIDQPALSGAFNLTAPEPVSNSEFTAALARQLHRPAVLPVPAAVLRVLLGDMSQLLLGGQRALPQRMLDAGYVFAFEQLPAALADVLKR